MEKNELYAHLHADACHRYWREILRLYLQKLAKASKLFHKKWIQTKDRRVTDFANYFHTNWVVKNSLWFEGATPGYPSTNNGIESTNAVIKKAHTFRERLPVVLFGIADTWSKQSNPASVNCISFVKMVSNRYVFHIGLGRFNGQLEMTRCYNDAMMLTVLQGTVLTTVLLFFQYGTIPNHHCCFAYISKSGWKVALVWSLQKT